jgi:hypothetical protein
MLVKCELHIIVETHFAETSSQKDTRRKTFRTKSFCRKLSVEPDNLTLTPFCTMCFCAFLLIKATLQPCVLQSKNLLFEIRIESRLLGHPLFSTDAYTDSSSLANNHHFL